MEDATVFLHVIHARKKSRHCVKMLFKNKRRAGEFTQHPGALSPLQPGPPPPPPNCTLHYNLSSVGSAYSPPEEQTKTRRASSPSLHSVNIPIFCGVAFVQVQARENEKAHTSTRAFRQTYALEPGELMLPPVLTATVWKRQAKQNQMTAVISNFRCNP